MTKAESAADPHGPAAIHAVPLRHPWRWVGAIAIIVVAGLFLYGAATNPAYGWDTYLKYLLDERVAEAAWNTVQLTIYAMAIGLVLGVVLAVMRLSPNPVFRAVAWGYLWIFRGTPVYVQLVFWGLFHASYIRGEGMWGDGPRQPILAVGEGAAAGQ